MHESRGTLWNPEERLVYDEVLTRHRSDELENCRITWRDVDRLFVPNEVLIMPFVNLVENRADDMPVGTNVVASIHKEEADSVALVHAYHFAEQIWICQRSLVTVE